MSQLRNSDENDIFVKSSPLQFNSPVSTRTSTVQHKLRKLKYNRESKIYAEEGVTYQHHIMLWHAALANSQNAAETKRLYRKLVRVKSLLLMDAIELTHWVITLEEQGELINKTKVLLFTGFACKQLYSSDLKAIEAKCRTFIPAFSKKFKQWASLNTTIFPIHPVELNQKFSELISSTIVKRSFPRNPQTSNIRKYSEVSYKSDISTEEDCESRMENDMLNFEHDTMKGEKLSPIDDFFTLV